VFLYTGVAKASTNENQRVQSGDQDCETVDRTSVFMLFRRTKSKSSFHALRV
jgi:hypothetical protein